MNDSVNDITKWIIVALQDGNQHLDSDTAYLLVDDIGQEEIENIEEGLAYLARETLITYKPTYERQNKIIGYEVSQNKPYFLQFATDNGLLPKEGIDFIKTELRITEDYIKIEYDTNEVKVKSFKVDSNLGRFLSYAANSHPDERVTYLEATQKLKGMPEKGYGKSVKDEILKDPKMKNIAEVYFDFPSSDSVRITPKRLLMRNDFRRILESIRNPEKSR